MGKIIIAMLLVASLLQAVYAEESSKSQEQCNDCDEYSADYKKVDDGRFFKKRRIQT